MSHYYSTKLKTKEILHRTIGRNESSNLFINITINRIDIYIRYVRLYTHIYNHIRVALKVGEIY